MSKIKTVVFDAFGTLFQDSPEHWNNAMEAIIRQQGLNVSVDTLNQAWVDACGDFHNTRSNPGADFQSYAVAWQDAFAAAFRALKLSGDPAAAADYWIRDMAGRDPYPETLEALKAVAQRWQVVVLSNADDVFLDPALERLGFPFAASLSSEGAHCYKPNPELFEAMLRRLGITPQEAVYVGDRQYEDIHGAGQAGLGTVWINRTGVAPEPALRAPDYRIESLLELADLLGT
jgi:2-haloacid dehalogenase